MALLSIQNHEDWETGENSRKSTNTTPQNPVELFDFSEKMCQVFEALRMTLNVSEYLQVSKLQSIIDVNIEG